MTEEFEEEIRQMEEDMQSQMSGAASVKSRAQEIMDQVMAEEEEKMSMMSQSQAQSQKKGAGGTSNAGEDDEEGDDDGEGEDDSDEEGHNVFYKANELIVSRIFHILIY